MRVRNLTVRRSRSRQRLTLGGALLASLSVAATPSPAEVPPVSSRDVHFRHLTNKDGLSQNTVFAIAQDRQGFMWFGTKVGLNRYDGYSFRTFNKGLSEGFIRALREDPEGALWIGTYGGGLNRFDPVTETFTHYKNDPDNPASLSDDDIRALIVDRSGSLWVGTRGGGLNRLETDGSFTRFQSRPNDPEGLSHNDIRAIVEDRSGNLWIGTYGGGLNRRSPDGSVTQFRQRRGDPTSLIDNRIRALVEDRNDNLWVGTTDGLARLDPDRRTFTHFRHDPATPGSLSDNRVRSLFQDSSGDLWVGTRTGLNLFDPDSETFVDYHRDPDDPLSLSGESAYSIFEDSSGGLWIGTYNGGLNRFDPAKESFQVYRHDPETPAVSLSADEVSALHADPSGQLWIGTFGGGLNRLDADREQFRHYRPDRNDSTSLADNRVSSLLTDSSGELWVGMYDSGLSRFDRETEAFTHYRHDPQDANSLSRDYVRALLEDSSGRLWIGTQGGGLNHFDPTSETFTHYRHDPKEPASLGHDSVVVLSEGLAGSLWVGTYGGGLDHFDPGTRTFTHHRFNPQNPTSLSHDAISAIHRDRVDNLWVGTYGGGLNRFDRETGTFTRFTEANSPMTNAILGLLEDERGRLWLSTNRGLTRFDPTAGHWTSYDIGDGLQDVEFNPGAFDLSPEGEMFFGGNRGFNAFFPERFTDNAFVPPVVLTSFKVFEQEISGDRASSYAEEIELSFEDNFFSFEFAALSFRRPDKNRYLYTLEGLDEGWIDAGSKRDARYTKVPPGDYVFRVKGSNNDGVWNEDGASVRITITPPFWQTPAFYAFEAFMILGLLASAFLIQRRRHKRHEAAALRELDLRRKHEELSAAEQWARELEDKNRQLEDKNQQILHTQAQLVHSEKMASLGQLVAGVAHEINNPVSFITSGLPTLRRDIDKLGDFVDEDRRDERFEAVSKRIGTLVNVIDEGAQRTSEIVRNLRSFSRLDQAELEIIDLHRGLDSTLNLLQRLTGNRITVVRNYGRIPRVECFGSQLNQVFMNLIVNAIQAIEREGTVTLTTTPVGDDHVRVAIRDTGCGMPEEIRQKIFDPFFTTKPVGEGTGLGLSISQRIVEAHSATLEIESEPGQGTEITITLPIRMQVPVNQETSQPSEPVTIPSTQS